LKAEQAVAADVTAVTAAATQAGTDYAAISSAAAAIAAVNSLATANAAVVLAQAEVTAAATATASALAETNAAAKYVADAAGTTSTADDALAAAAAQTALTDTNNALAATNAAKADLAAAQAKPAGYAAQTFTLTTGQDSGAAFTGAAGISTFNATGSTLSALDTLNGGTGTNNVLNLVDTAGVLNTTVPTGVSVSNIQTMNVTTTGGVGSIFAAGSPAVKQVVTITDTSGTYTAADQFSVNYNGITVTATTAATNTFALALTAIANAINGLAGATIATVVGSSVVISAPVAGTALPTITVSNLSNPLDLFTPVTAVANAAQVASAANAVYDVSGFTGLTSFNVTASSGADNIKVAATTAANVVDTGGAVTLSGGLTQTVTGSGALTLSGSKGLVTATDSAQGASAISINGGVGVTLTDVGQTTGTITVGNTSAPTGAVVITTGIAAGVTGGQIAVTGGTTVSVTEAAVNANGTTVTAESAVTVTGKATTTSVNITQAAVAAAVAGTAAAVAGVNGVAAQAAAPGTQAIAQVNAVAASAATTAAPGIAADGAVVIVDASYNTTTANTITSVTLSNFASALIQDNALSTLSLSGTGGVVTITDATNGAGGVPATNAALALTVNGLSNTTLVDTNNEIATLNVTTGALASKLGAITDTSLTTLNVSGASTLTMTAALPASLTKIAISGAAGFSDGGTTAANGFAALHGAATLTTTSSGAITASLDDLTQTFVGSTGKDVITVSSTANATKAITGGSGATDELILEGGAYVLTSATAAKITGFETLGVAANVTGVIDVSVLGTGYHALDIIGAGTIAFTKVATGSTVSLDASGSSTTINYIDANGATDATTVTIGAATNAAAIVTTALTLEDANNVGVGTVNFVSNDTAFNGTNTIVGAGFGDTGLQNLNISGTGALSFTASNFVDNATSLTINNTETNAAGVSFFGISDDSLGNLTFKGSNVTTVTTLSDAGSTLTLANTGTAAANITNFSTATLVNLTLNGNVQIGNTVAGGAGLIDTATTGVTINGATDNAHVNVQLAASSGVDTIVLGNGNNSITDATITGGTVNVTVGTGSNLLTLGGTTTNTTATFAVTLGTHTAAGPDFINVGTAGTAFATVANYVITGAVTGDQVFFRGDVLSSNAALTATTAGATAAATITAIEAAAHTIGAHGVAYAVFGGNTYIAESLTGTLAGTDTTLVELIGTHTLTAALGHVTVAS